MPAHVREFVEPVFRRFTTPHEPAPRTHLLSNGRYAVMLTTAGSGYSRCAGLGVTRWREDATRDRGAPTSSCATSRAARSGRPAYQPTGVEPTVYRRRPSRRTARSSIGGTARSRPRSRSSSRPRTTPRSAGSRSRTGVTRVRELELTSYAELVLAPPAADAAHPAFSNLFVQTEFVADLGALLATRRARSPAETAVWAAHVVAVEGQPAGGAQYETDRARFLGRGRSDPHPDVRHRRSAPVEHRGRGARPDLQPAAPDPARPGRARPAHLLDAGRAVTRGRARPWPTSTATRRPSSATVTLAWTQAQVQLHHLGIEPRRGPPLPATRQPRPVLRSRAARRAGRAAAEHAPARRPSGPTASPATCRSSSCASTRPEDRGIVRQLLRAHEYWRLKGLAVDLVILNEKAHSYVQDLQTALEALVRTSQSAPRPERSAAARRRLHPARRTCSRPRTTRLLQSAARAVLAEPPRHARGAARARRVGSPAAALPAPRPIRAAAAAQAPPAAPRARVLQRPRRLRGRTAAST